MALLKTDPVDLALDNDGQLVIPLRHTSGLEAIAQGIRIRLLMFRGEWFLDLDEGIPYVEGNGVDPNVVILGNPFDRDLAEVTFRAAIAKVPGVAAITRMDVEFDGETRVMSISYQVNTVWGDTVADVLERKF